MPDGKYTMKTYLITGASGGIGSGIARKLAKEGHALILCGNRNEAALRELSRECSEYTTCKTFLGDLSKESFVKENKIFDEVLFFKFNVSEIFR